jgi:hypothetical protein
MIKTIRKTIYWCKICLRILIIPLHTYIHISLHTKFAALVCLEEGQLLPAMENRVKFLILWHRTLRLKYSIQEGQNFDPMKS